MYVIRAVGQTGHPMSVLREHVSVTIATRSGDGNDDRFYATARGVVRRDGSPIASTGVSKDQAYAAALSLVLREIADEVGQEDRGGIPDRMVIEVRRDRSHG